MTIKATEETCFIFDLDDTLYSEIDFLKSAYKSIANGIDANLGQKIYENMLQLYFAGENVFKHLLKEYPTKLNSLEDIINNYRQHVPDLCLKKGAYELIIKIKNKSGKTGIITNGRSTTQRNKIQALGLTDLIDKIIISEEVGFEKPAPDIYKSFMDEEKFQFYYFGDNPKIDFITPKQLGWCCIGISDSGNIHANNLFDYSLEFLPHLFIQGFNEVEII